MNLTDICKIESLLQQALGVFYTDDDCLKNELNENTRKLLVSITIALDNSQNVFQDVKSGLVQS
jgi:hypothetical protein